MTRPAEEKQNTGLLMYMPNIKFQGSSISGS